MTKRNLTIKDIARLTKLSNGTVDRVLHNRGGVSQRSYNKVMKVIQDQGYEPNIHASMLAYHKEHTIAVVIPEHSKGDFWALYQPGLDKAAEYARTFNVKVEKVCYNQYDIEDFRRAYNEIIEMEPSGVIVAPMFKNETHNFTDRLMDKGIPYVFTDSKLEQDGYLAYFGMPMYQSGYLCGYLLTDRQKVDDIAIIRIERDAQGLSDPTVNRRAGFLDYIMEHFPACRISNVFINPTDQVKIDETLSAFFAENPQVRNIVMFNSRIHLIAGFLQAHGMKGYNVVGFDNLEQNIYALKKGFVHTLITQHPETQAYNAVKAIVDFLVLKKAPDSRDNFMHMDILTKFNTEYY